MKIEDVRKEVEGLRQTWGAADICTDVWEENGLAGYIFMPNNEFGYHQEYRLEDGAERHCGLGLGCFWTDWK